MAGFDRLPSLSWLNPWQRPLPGPDSAQLSGPLIVGKDGALSELASGLRLNNRRCLSPGAISTFQIGPEGGLSDLCFGIERLMADWLRIAFLLAAVVVAVIAAVGFSIHLNRPLPKRNHRP
jgi:hypothetical protein